MALIETRVKVAQQRDRTTNGCADERAGGSANGSCGWKATVDWGRGHRTDCRTDL